MTSAHAHPGQEMHESRRARPETTLRVLLVEASRERRAALAAQLNDDRFRLAEAESRPEALRVLLQHPPEVIIVGEPAGMSGAELVRSLRVRWRRRFGSLPVLGLAPDAAQEREMFRAGADCNVHAPVARGDLAATVLWVARFYGRRSGCAAELGTERSTAAL